MAQRKLSAEALALIYLREERRWTQKELADAKGLSSYRVISRYENGNDPLRRKELGAMAALMGFSREAVDALLFVYSLVSPPEPEESAFPVELTPEELRRIDRAVIGEAWIQSAELRSYLLAETRRRKVAEDRRHAGELWARLKALPSRERRELVEDSPEFQSWALVERLCLESKHAAADSAERARDLASLALFAAARVQGAAPWLARLQGYAWAYRANAERVANDQPAADKAFARAWQLWRAGDDGGLLPEWRMLSLEASLRRDVRRLPEALSLLDRALKAAGADPEARGVILLKKAFVHDQMGDPEGALKTLREAAPCVEARGDRRLVFALRFEIAKGLWALERFAEAEELLPEVRERAVELGNELDLVRVGWLAARVAAGQGRWEEASSGLEQVRRDFTARGLFQDAALAGLELALLHLKAGRTAEVKELARQMAPVFQARGIAREALAAFTVFHEAAQREGATVELALRAIAEVEAARRSAPRPRKGREERP
ncbi:MAG TPA: helix-turn-helix transcriptional regulator [Thermoanaerobaculia bacterium]|nr:helix-turn-helix transcriptional regulator [Thermoanaerobaculia bacterium]